MFHYQRLHIDKSQLLGHGSYGAVYKVRCDQLPCAAKLIHTAILDPADPGVARIINRFQQECAFLESIRHPNIVQYLGTTVDPDSRQPVLLMELLDESLTKMLERFQQPLRYCIQVDICHDIALAVAYLHSNGIIHRDLSSNNVLIIAERRAKVTDFGMSKLSVAAPGTGATPLTRCPGTSAYMSPEALREFEPPRYTEKLDCFSEGVLTIQICTRLWPEPGPRTRVIHDSRSPTGIMEMPVPERERRKKHIDLIDPTHPLLPLAIDCLNFREEERPSSVEVCQRLATLKEDEKYKESVQLRHNGTTTVEESLSTQILAQQLEEKDQEIQTKTEQFNRQLREKDDHLQRLEVELTSKQRQLRELNRQLEEQEQVTAQIQQANQLLRRQLEQLQPATQGETVKAKNQEGKPHPPLKTTLQWIDGGKAPYKLSRGTAMADSNLAYFTPDGYCMCMYDFDTKKWTKLPHYPYSYNVCFAVVDGQLTGIGGAVDISMSGNTYSKELFSLTEQRTWVSVLKLPPMPSERYDVCALTAKEHLIVAGGINKGVDDSKFSTVEVLNTKTRIWSAVANLCHPYSRASVTICGDHVYILGGCDNNLSDLKSVITCSLSNLLKSTPSSAGVWRRVANVPLYMSTCASVCGELLAVGGCVKDSIVKRMWREIADIAHGIEGRKAKDCIYRYNQKTNTWDLIGHIPTPRWNCLVAVGPAGEIMVVGGEVSEAMSANEPYRPPTDKVEIGRLSYS